MRTVVLAGGIGGARFLEGLRAAMATGTTRDQITVIGNTGDDITLFGLRVCPDLDTVMYTLGGGINTEQGWGRAAETFTVREELAAYGAQPQWFTLGDRDFATHIVRTRMLAEGTPLSTVTAHLCARWQPGVELIPMTDDPVETHVRVSADTGPRELHFQEWWVRHGARLTAHGFRSVGADEARPAPGVLAAIEAADVILLPPSNPVVSIGSILSVPGIRSALLPKTVVGVSPIIGNAPVRGMADACLRAIGVETSAAAVARHYGPDLLDGWLVDDSDRGVLDTVPGTTVRARPLYMHDTSTTAEIAQAALDLAWDLQKEKENR
ncbi:2-phospho-L-lactate transferase [Lipingzhangella sp. LS1_29]|uniref:2-phospho-L-lactate transferase n=1 Tax=Lipingzhangella rawalii TaxID=2055835 RepID=A0ABU2H516_9ACTN|nr:2-phospho-L-lactate transferase [Lipingzhangella rawalii]MDS1270381.1 2-phospho-L-lactate transferase [Lipingzhangella rawalii]